jgi:NADH:ubiquinone reductase (non-electrogenic)
VAWNTSNLEFFPLQDTSEIKGRNAPTTIPYDYLVYAVGAETQTFNIPGVKEHAVFMKELRDAERVRITFTHPSRRG